MKITIQQFRLLRQVADAVIDAVAAAGHTGAPGGVVYAALMRSGCTLQQFEGIMGGLVPGRGFSHSRLNCKHD